MEGKATEAVRSSRRKLIILILIAFVPIFIAYFGYFYFPSMAPAGTTNQGELISPPLTAASFDPKLGGFKTWVLLQPVDTDCDERCEEMLYLSRQVVTGLGKDASRVQRLLLAPGQVSDEFDRLLADEHPDVQVQSDTAAALDAVSTERPVLFLMDPNGNIMMFYRLEQAGKPMLKDLKHLLRISNIG